MMEPVINAPREVEADVVRSGPSVLCSAYEKIELVSRDYINMSVLFFCSLLVHSFFIIRGLGEADAGRLLQCAVLWHVTGDAAAAYSRVSPLYVNFMKLLLDWDVSIASIPTYLNWFNVFMSSMAIFPVYCFWKMIFNRNVALWGTIFLLFSPSFWLASIYGMPHLPAFVFLSLALLFFLLALEDDGKVTISLYLLSLVSMMVACTFKADIFLCGSAFGAVVLLKKKLSVKTAVLAVIPAILGVASPIVYYKFIALPDVSTSAFANQWSDQYLFTIKAFLNRKNLLVLPHVNGPVIFYTALTAALIVSVICKKQRWLILAVLIWILPTEIWWGFRDGNSSRHMMMAFSIFPYLCGLLLFAIIPQTKYKFLPHLACFFFLILNYYSTEASGDGVIYPSTQIFSSKRLLQKVILDQHKRAKDFVALKAEKKAFIGGATNPYTLYEVFNNATEIHFPNRANLFEVKKESGIMETVLWREIPSNNAAEEAARLKKEGWAVWSQEFDLAQLDENSMDEDLRSPSVNLVKISNPGFETWEGSLPSGYTVRDGGIVRKTTANPYEGNAALELSTGQKLSYLYQNIALDPSFGGKKVIVSTMAKADRDRAVVWVYTVINGVQSKTLYGAPHPGDGKWHRIGVALQLPEKTPEGRLCFVLEGEPSNAIEFDDVKMYTK